MNLPESPLLAEVFLEEAKSILNDSEDDVVDITKAAEKLAFAAAYAGPSPDVKLVGKILRLKARLSEMLVKL
jgi:hypothetical protein